MPNYLQLPGGLPWWAVLAIAVPIALYVLLLLAMPFSVFGVKGRLDLLEGRLDEIHEEIRNLALRSQEVGLVRSQSDYRESVRSASLPQHEVDLPRLRPEPAEPRRQPSVRSERSEPRLDWPR